MDIVTLINFVGSKFETLEPKYLKDLYRNVYVLNLGCNNQGRSLKMGSSDDQTCRYCGDVDYLEHFLHI